MADIGLHGAMETGRGTVANSMHLALPIALYLASLVLPIFFYIGPLNMSLMRFLLLVTFVPMMIALLSGKAGKIYIVDILFFSYIIWIMVSLTAMNPDRVIENAGSTGLEFLGGYMIGRVYVRDRETFARVVWILAIITAATLPLAIVESLGKGPFVLDFLNKIPGIRSNYDVNYEPRMGLLRAQTVFAHPIHYGLFASTSFAIVLIGMAGTIKQSTRIMLAAGIGLSVFLSLSSGALLALILQIFLILWALVLRNVRRRWMILFGLIAAAYVGIDLLSNRSPTAVFMTYATFSPHNAYIRQVIFEWGMVNFWGSPIFGIGFNDWVRPDWLHNGSMDNFWLVQAVRHGFLAFATLAAGWLWTLWKVSKKDFSKDPILSNIRLGWMITFVGMTLSLVTVHIWTTLYSFVFFLFGSGIWLLSETGTPTASQDDSDSPSPRPTSAYTRFPAGGPRLAPTPRGPRTALTSQRPRTAPTSNARRQIQ